MPQKIGAQIEEIFEMRREYDADASRSALIRAKASLKKVEKQLGQTSYLKKSQTRVLKLAADIAADIKNAEKSVLASLPSKKTDKTGTHSKSRSLVQEEAAMLSADSADLKSEIARLDIHYRLNNFLFDGDKNE
jgi:uncharacterized protein YicC (UPF0701 family)